MTTEQRLARLERENRWMRRVGAVAVTAVVALFLIGQAAVLLIGQARGKPDLVVRSLKMEDKAGGTRFEFHALDDGAAILEFLDKDGKSRVELGTLADGRAVLALRDKDANPRVSFGTHDDGTASVILYDRHGTNAFSLLTDRSLTFYDPNGKVIWKAPQD